MLNDNTKSYLHLHLIVFIWGFTAILGRLISIDALPLVWFRMLLAVVFIFVYMKIKKQSFILHTQTIIKFLVTGLIIALHWFTFFKAIKVSNVSITLACLSTGAFFTSIIEPVFFRKKIVWYEILLGLTVVFGLSIIFNFEGNYTFGIVLALLSALLSASFSVINSLYVKKHDAEIISFYELLGGVIFFSFFLLFSSGFTSNFFQLSISDFIYLLILSSICTAYAFIASTKVMKYLSPYTVMLTINLEPVYGIILAVIIFKETEKMSTPFYIGATIIIVTVILNRVLKNYFKSVKKM